MATTRGATRRRRADGPPHVRPGQPALQGCREGTRQVDECGHRQRRRGRSHRALPRQRSRPRWHRPRGPPTPAPRCATGGSTPRGRSVPATTGRLGPSATTAAVANARGRPTRREHQTGDGDDEPDEVEGCRRPPPQREARHGVDDIVLTLGHPQPTGPGQRDRHHADGHDRRTQDVVDGGQRRHRDAPATEDDQSGITSGGQRSFDRGAQLGGRRERQQMAGPGTQPQMGSGDGAFEGTGRLDGSLGVVVAPDQLDRTPQRRQRVVVAFVHQAHQDVAHDAVRGPVVGRAVTLARPLHGRVTDHMGPVQRPRHPESQRRPAPTARPGDQRCPAQHERAHELGPRRRQAHRDPAPERVAHDHRRGSRPGPLSSTSCATAAAYSADPQGSGEGVSHRTREGRAPRSTGGPRGPTGRATPRSRRACGASRGAPRPPAVPLPTSRRTTPHRRATAAPRGG